MDFDGCIEAITQRRISGWAQYRDGPDKGFPELTLQFRKRGNFRPTSTFQRPNGITGFVFELPAKFGELSWAEFVDDFEALYARHPTAPGERRWVVPFWKNVLVDVDRRNPTALLADVLKSYNTQPQSNGRLAIYTLAYNEYVMLPLWAKYYAQEFGAENVFVIDQGSHTSYTGMLPDRVTIIRIPRDEFNHWLLARLSALFQRFLLESYDTVVFAETDEFICAAPDVRQGKPLRQFLLDLPHPIGVTKGFNLLHDLSREPGYDASRPVLQQRRFLRPEPTMDKPLVTRLPLNWTPGFHRAREGGEQVKGLYLLHLRWFDFGVALQKAANYRASRWNQLDLDRKLASYQRATEDELTHRFRSWSADCAGQGVSGFDEHAAVTVVPDWMREAVWI